MEETIEVLHTVTGDRSCGDLVFTRKGNKYSVKLAAYSANNWMSMDEVIKWAFIPSAMEPCHKMDKFIKGYFPESLVILAALENA